MSWLVFLLVLVAAAAVDRLYRINASASRDGQDKTNEVALEAVLSEPLAALYFDPSWAIESKRAFWAIRAVSRSLQDKLPTYVLEHVDWAPKDPAFAAWWEAQVARGVGIPSFELTKYRAILVFLQRGAIARAFINFYSGEGGPECVAASGARALALPPPIAVPSLLSFVCDVLANHTLREAADPIWLWGAPRGWSREPQAKSEEAKDGTCNEDAWHLIPGPDRAGALLAATLRDQTLDSDCQEVAMGHVHEYGCNCALAMWAKDIARAAEERAQDLADVPPSPGSVTVLAQRLFVERFYAPPPATVAGGLLASAPSSGEVLASLDLGPVVVGKDGTLGCIQNWAKLTAHERAAALKSVQKRNAKRKEQQRGEEL
jgi:hypothetical protein